MPRIARSREVEARPDEVWRLVSDPGALPRWWPRVVRVEAVEGRRGETGCRWTKVLSTRAGRGVRADYRCIASSGRRRYAWAQELEATPFAKHLAAAETEVIIEGSAERTLVTIVLDQRLRGLSRLGGPLMKSAGRKLLEEALDGIDGAIARSGGS